MDYIKFKEQVIGELLSGKTSSAINHLVINKFKFNQELENDIVIIANRYKNINKEFNKGNTTAEQKDTSINKLTYSILDLLVKVQFQKDQIHENDYVGNALREFNAVILSHSEFKTNFSNIRKSIDFHKQEVKKWADFINFKDSSKQKITTQVFVELDYYITPKRNQIKGLGEEKTINLKEIFYETKDLHLVILGQPGAGKTTTMKKIALNVLESTENFAEFSFPLVIRLRELNNTEQGNIDPSKYLIAYILNILGVKLEASLPSTEHTNSFEYDEYFLNNLVIKATSILLDNLNVVIILDGLDELREELKEKITEQIKGLAKWLNKSKLIITTRTGEYYQSIDNTSEYEICPLSNIQIEGFINRWLCNEIKAEDLFNKISKSPFFDTIMRPLTLAHLCAIYERYNNIPEKPKTIYKKIINLLLEEWDNQRDVVRESKYANFEIDRKFEFLSSLAFYITTQYRLTIFSRQKLLAAYKILCNDYGLPENENDLVVNEIESHNGLILKSGYDSYEFAHKSIQEYLTAEFIVKFPILPAKMLTLEFPNEMALACGISSNPTVYFSTLTLQFLKKKPSGTFVETFLERLIIEKPDFSLNPLLGLGFLNLFTHSLRYEDDMAILKFGKAQFIKFSKYKHVSESIYKALNYYMPVKTYQFGIIEYSNIKKFYSTNPLFLSGYEMPKKICIHQSFINSENKT